MQIHFILMWIRTHFRENSDFFFLILFCKRYFQSFMSLLFMFIKKKMIKKKVILIILVDFYVSFITNFFATRIRIHVS